MQFKSSKRQIHAYFRKFCKYLAIYESKLTERTVERIIRSRTIFHLLMIFHLLNEGVLIQGSSKSGTNRCKKAAVLLRRTIELGGWRSWRRRPQFWDLKRKEGSCSRPWLLDSANSVPQAVFCGRFRLRSWSVVTSKPVPSSRLIFVLKKIASIINYSFADGLFGQCFFITFDKFHQRSQFR